MNKELKEQVHKEFDEFFKNKLYDISELYGQPHVANDKTKELKAFIDSLIDKTYEKGYSDCWNQFKDMDTYQLGVQMTEERIVGIIEESKDGSDGDVALDYVIKLIKRK